MAIDTNSAQGGATSRRFLIGTNVAVTVVLVVGIIAVVQAIAYSTTVRFDMTSTGINSLSPGTENLLRNLDQNVRITSLYFETDREDEDQSKYRRAVQDLIDLYEATNRSKITAEWINPLKNREKFGTLLARLREKSAFKSGLAAYEERFELYKTELDDQMREMIKSELDRIAATSTSFGAASDTKLTQIENVFMRLSSEFERAREQVDSYTSGDNPDYSTARDGLRNIYKTMSQALKDIGAFGQAQVAQTADMPEAEIEFLRGANGRYAGLVGRIEGERTKLDDLERLALDDITRELEPTTNAILVETPDDAKVVNFGTVWPPNDARTGSRAAFKDRGFKGEEKLTSAILRATHKEQTAVIFVRYSGMPLLTGIPMMGQPPAPYQATKETLENANFVVKEWDLKASTTVPKIDPEPTRRIYIVLKPTAPRRGPMGQPSQGPQFNDSHRKAIIDAIAKDGRAIFIAGWAPGPFGPIPSTYEYGDYLKDSWGIEVDTSLLLLKTVNIAPGKYGIMRGQDPLAMNDFNIAEHDIVNGLESVRVSLPWVAPLKQSDPTPDGVQLQRLIEVPARDGLWGVTNIQKYDDQLRTQQHMSRLPEDPLGPFDVAYAAVKGDAKTVVVSSREFAEDQVAFARQMAFTAQGITVQMRNPGNITLLVNSLHWLNDNTEFMNIGKPIDAAVLEVDQSTVKFVQIFTIFVWPALALCGGGIAWWVRRR